MNTKLDKVRIDKWLWAVRIFKSRTQATDAAQSGKVTINGKSAKPSQNVSRGDTVTVKKEGFNLVYKVVDLLEKRVAAEVAAPCYVNMTPPEELNKFKEWYAVNTVSEFREKGVGRPTKRERRDIDKFKTDEELEAEDNLLDEFSLD
jgi:ribosome-associated heat shock protein Hsp15